MAPRGWPRAMEPPLTLTRPASTPRASMKCMGTAAKASLTSNRSMSDRLMPLRWSNLRVATVGPVIITVGSEPTSTKERMRARGLRPAARPPASLPISTAQAPSTMPDELPAWCTWPMDSSCG
ncbi:hypothetical protein D9M69_546070 [compost metagenome]